MGTRESGWFHDIVNALTCELCTLFFSFLKILFIYLTESETASERGNTSRGSGRGRSKLLAEEPDVGLDPRMLGSHPEPKADA